MGVETLIAAAGTAAAGAIGSKMANDAMGSNKQSEFMQLQSNAPTGGSGGLGAAAAQARGAANQGANVQFPTRNGPDYANGIDAMGDEQVANLIRMLLGKQP